MVILQAIAYLILTMIDAPISCVSSVSELNFNIRILFR